MGSTVEQNCLTCHYETEPCEGCSLFNRWEPKHPAKVEGIKHDNGKPRYDLIPSDFLDGFASMFSMGAEKYDDRNWEKGMDWNRIYSALERHARKWWRGENYDAEDGQHHLLSVAWCAAVLYAYQARGVGRDNRDRLPAFDPSFWSSHSPRHGCKID